MANITGCNVYIPRYRLKREAIAQAWGTRATPGSKAVSNFDEDALTMAYAAAWPLIGGAAPPDRLYFASTTSPYWQRSAASQIAAACDLDASTATADFGGSLRSGFTALFAAVEAIAAGAARDIVVVASDRRDGEPESADETMFGDAAAAFRISLREGMAAIETTASRSDDFLDEWRRDTDGFVHGYSSKYTVSRGYEANIVAVAKRLLVENPAIAGASLNGPDPRAAAAVGKSLGIAADGMRDGFAGEIGITGAAMPLIAAAQALASAQSGDRILCIAYGDGADGFIARCTEPAPPVRAAGAKTIEYGSYALYRKSREYMRTNTRGPEISNVLWKKEERQNIRLHGTKCPECGRLQFPMARVCGACRNVEGLQEIPLRRTGQVFTFTKDYLYDAPVQPTVMAVVDLDGGGRFLCQMTDADERQVRIGMPVELVLRRMRGSADNHSYYWKCRPVENGPEPSAGGLS